MEKLQYGRKKNSVAPPGSLDAPVLEQDVFEQFDTGSQHTTPEGVQYWFDLRKVHSRYGRSRIVGYSLSLDKAIEGRLRLVPQNPIDSLMIETGLSGERQFGEAAFDDTVFIDCDDKLLVERVLGNRRQRDACLRLFEQGCGEICIDHNGLVARMPNDLMVAVLEGESQFDCLARQAAQQVAWLAELAISLPERQPFDRFGAWRRGTVAGVLFLAAVLVFFLPDDYVTGNAMPMEAVRLNYGLLSGLIAFFTIIVSLINNRGRAAPHRLAFWRGLAAFSVMMLFLPGFAYLNRDGVAGRPAGALVDSLREVKHKGSVSYQARVINLLDSGASVWFSVSKWEYELAKDRQACLHFDLYPGRFGVAYHANMRVMEITERQPCPVGRFQEN